MKKPVQIFYIVVLTVFILLPGPLYMMVRSHIDTKNYENRDLASLPDMITQGISRSSIDSFPNQFEDWLNDHLPFKNQLLTLSGDIDYHAFKDSNSETVIIGKNGWLFYKGSKENGEDPVADYLGTNRFTEAELEKIAANMIQARDDLAAQGRDFVIFIAPNKERVYSEYMPDEYGQPSADGRIYQVVKYLQEHTDLKVVCPLQAFEEYKKAHPDMPLYFRYDTHWNNLGAYIGAQQLSEALGYKLPDLENTTVLSNIGEGNFDLARLLHLSRELGSDQVYAVENYSQYYNVLERSEDNTQFRTYNSQNNAAHEKFVMVGDSFNGAMFPYVAVNYNNAYSCFYYDYTPDLLEEESPNVVVYEVVERYLGNMENFSIYNFGLGQDEVYWRHHG